MIEYSFKKMYFQSGSIVGISGENTLIFVFTFNALKNKDKYSKLFFVTNKKCHNEKKILAVYQFETIHYTIQNLNKKINILLCNIKFIYYNIMHYVYLVKVVCMIRPIPCSYWRLLY